MEAIEEVKLQITGDEVDVSEEEMDKLEGKMSDRVFILQEIMKIAVKLDYTDEIGRRKMFQVTREEFAFYHIIQFSVNALTPIIIIPLQAT